MNGNGADIKLECGFQSVHFNTVLTNNKGDNLAKSGHVINVTEVISLHNGYSVVTSNVIRQTSVSLQPWKVKLEVCHIMLYNKLTIINIII